MAGLYQTRPAGVSPAEESQNCGQQANTSHSPAAPAHHAARTGRGARAPRWASSASPGATHTQ